MVLPLLFGLAASAYAAKKNSKAIDKSNKANLPSNQVKEWEKAGINPLVGITQGQWISQQANTAIGDAFLETGLSTTQAAIQQMNAEKLQETQLKHENQMLEKRLKVLDRNQEPTNMQKYGDLIPIGNPNDNLTYRINPVSGRSGSALSGPVRLESRDLSSPFGVIDVDETVDQAEWFEQEYGEIGAEGVGVVKLFNDGMQSLADHYDNQVSAFPDEAKWKFYSWGWGGKAQHRPKARPIKPEKEQIPKPPSPSNPYAGLELWYGQNSLGFNSHTADSLARYFQ